jgi:phage gpG-like protein
MKPGVTMIANPKDMARAKARLMKIKAFSKKDLATTIATTISYIGGKAVSRAPVAGKGKSGSTLRKSIETGISGTKAYVGFKAEYAPYVEFGTGGKVDLKHLKALGIPDSYAAQFKGAGIKDVNLKARPFLFNSAREGIKLMSLKLKKKLARL